ncbi:MAG: ABC transporter permease [Firmicutes bacterium]|nr:ABC transporter permease [Bacillota bacterium]MCM1401561.1 ABC transporter permease [Bacteroides sp.]MCM1477255.1 ABC transporter permease [Bacteroides sp.]
MSLTSFVGMRISLKRDGHRASSGVLIAVTGIAVAFVIMLLAIAIVSGFKNQIMLKLQGFNSQISILPPNPSSETDTFTPLQLTPELQSVIREIIPDATISLTINQPAVLKTDSTFQGIILRGIKSGTPWDFIKENLLEGTIPDPSDTMALVLSKATADALNVSTGQKLRTHFFDGNNLRTRNLTVTGVYDSHFADFDKSLAFTPLPMLQQLFQIDSMAATAIDIGGLNFNDIPETSQRLYEKLLENSLHGSASRFDKPKQTTLYKVDNIVQQCSMYINWLNLLDTNVYVILTLMAFVSGFTLISSLFIIILEKVNMIGLFKALGATDTTIRKIFLFIAQRLVIKGLVIGNIIGVSIILLQQYTHLIPLNPDAYYLNFVPMELSFPALIILNIAVIVVAYAILILPSLLISGLSPVKTLKYE